MNNLWRSQKSFVGNLEVDQTRAQQRLASLLIVLLSLFLDTYEAGHGGGFYAQRSRL